MFIFQFIDERHCSSAKEAVQYRNVLELQRIVQQGENINVVDSKYSFSLLHWAAHYGSLEVFLFVYYAYIIFTPLSWLYAILPFPFFLKVMSMCMLTIAYLNHLANMH